MSTTRQRARNFSASEETRQATHLRSRTQVSDLTIEGAWQALCGCTSSTTRWPVAEVPVLEIVAASHILADRSPPPATVVHYFKEPGGTGNGGWPSLDSVAPQIPRHDQ
jgi:hypothetical protein